MNRACGVYIAQYIHFLRRKSCRSIYLCINIYSQCALLPQLHRLLLVTIDGWFHCSLVGLSLSTQLRTHFDKETLVCISVQNAKIILETTAWHECNTQNDDVVNGHRESVTFNPEIVKWISKTKVARENISPEKMKMRTKACPRSMTLEVDGKLYCIVCCCFLSNVDWRRSFHCRLYEYLSTNREAMQCDTFYSNNSYNRQLWFLSTKVQRRMEVVSVVQSATEKLFYWTIGAFEVFVSLDGCCCRCLRGKCKLRILNCFPRKSISNFSTEIESNANAIPIELYFVHRKSNLICWQEDTTAAAGAAVAWRFHARNDQLWRKPDAKWSIFIILRVERVAVILQLFRPGPKLNITKLPIANFN